MRKRFRIPSILFWMLVAGMTILPANAETSFIWRENFLVLSTGRASFRSLYDESSRNIIAGAPASILHLAEFYDARSSREWLSLYRVASDMGPAAGPILLDAADAAATDTALWPLLVAYGASRDTLHVDRLLRFTGSPDKRVRAAVALVCGDVALVSTQPLLAEVVHDTEAAVRRIAVDSLGRIFKAATAESDSAALRSSLEMALDDPDPWVRRNARKALGRP
ncbi:MAG: HEAT repeat domain-containing protein [Candidatus Hydrogenedentota bacterium]